MKTRLFYAAFICVIALLTGCGTAQKGLKGSTAKQLLGLWEVKAVHNSNEGGYKEMPNGMFKMILDNGRFINFMTTPKGAMITVDGTYRLVGDSIYIEEIDHSFNASQIGKDNPLNLKLSGNKFMYLRWFQAVDEFGENQHQWVEEIWQRVEIEDMEVSRIDLEQELRRLVKDPEAIRQVIN
ncbi:MAG: DUF4488 domain-containing protein [Bacteroidia bacterium]|nr:DUF4488 domain-containing protein [Bacteroidia bacterium]